MTLTPTQKIIAFVFGSLGEISSMQNALYVEVEKAYERIGELLADKELDQPMRQCLTDHVYMTVQRRMFKQTCLTFGHDNHDKIAIIVFEEMVRFTTIRELHSRIQTRCTKEITPKLK